MKVKQLKEFTFSTLRMAFKTITPWKKSWDGPADYNRGWNDCIKEIKKNRANYLKNLEKIASKF